MALLLAVACLAHRTKEAVDFCGLNATSIVGVTRDEWREASPDDVSCIEDTACASLPSAALASLGSSCSGWTGCFSYAPPAAFTEMSPACFNSLRDTALFSTLPAHGTLRLKPV
ncbi:hypothetical protein DIPPA_04003 [Diplonema papillatum]|nr:hypothetical protein DIPPA_04003 [Diplonema papillatum]